MTWQLAVFLFQYQSSSLAVSWIMYFCSLRNETGLHIGYEIVVEILIIRNLVFIPFSWILGYRRVTIVFSVVVSLFGLFRTQPPFSIDPALFVLYFTQLYTALECDRRYYTSEGYAEPCKSIMKLLPYRSQGWRHGQANPLGDGVGGRMLRLLLVHNRCLVGRSAICKDSRKR